MRQICIVAGLWIVSGCTALVGAPNDDMPESTGESGCFSQNTLPLGDPVTVSWASGLGDRAYDIAPLGDDVILMGGFFAPADFRGPGGAPLSLPAAADGLTDRTFLARLTADGAFRWAVDLPSRRVDIEPHLAVAADGSIYAAGLFEAPFDFDRGPGTDVHAPASTTDVFVTKYAADGTYQWTRTWISRPASFGEWDEPVIVALPDGSVVVSDRWASPDITKLASDGTIALVKPAGHQRVSTLAAGADGSLLVGFYDDATGSGIGRYDATLTQLDQQVLELGAGVTAISEIGDGRRIVAGTFAGENMDVYVASYAADGALQWKNTFGSRGNDRMWKLARGLDGEIFVGGAFYKTIDFDPTAGVDERTSRREDAVLVEYGADGSYRGVRTWGSTAQDVLYAVAVNASGTVFAAGTNDATLNFGSTAPDVRTGAGHADGFLVALAPVSPIAASGPACLPSQQPAPVNAALDGTSLPKSFAECEVLESTYVIYGEEGDGRCWFSVAKSRDAAQYQQCVDAGGGISVSEAPSEDYFCEIIFDEFAGACFGNFCD